ncbi:MAG: pantetheine-phosphate adenylyltransferase [Betaproteobacteria bacterium]|nr:pantetheine-phosphate adenylyltransferase [Betaproteobacteria bacterium]
MSKILYPGTFDPLTRGHEDLVKRAAGIFDQVIVAVAASASKDPLFSMEERIELAQTVFSGLANVRVIGFRGLLIDLAQREETRLVLRGLRAVSDFEYEFQLAGMNRMLLPDLETVFLTPDGQYMFLSATMVREIARLGGEIDAFVSPLIADRVIARLKST